MENIEKQKTIVEVNGMENIEKQNKIVEVMV